MRSTRLPFIVFGFLYSAFVVLLLLTNAQLPEQVASHFGAGGTADGWISRGAHVRYMLIF